MTFTAYFLESVLPHLPEQQRRAFRQCYPSIRVTEEAGFVSLQSIQTLMLVALTGTGKSTTIKALSANHPTLFDLNTLPSRREIADFFVIPTVQAMLGENIQPVADRRQRFQLTKLFAENFDGGIASVYASLYCRADAKTLLSEGIRGHSEIEYGLQNCSGWHILELSLNPLIRLQRLSTRNDDFDQAESSYDFDFLPPEFRETARNLYAQGRISTKALAIIQAEANNYSLLSHDIDHARYNCLCIDDLTPQHICKEIYLLIERMNSHATDQIN